MPVLEFCPKCGSKCIVGKRDPYSLGFRQAKGKEKMVNYSWCQNCDRNETPPYYYILFGRRIWGFRDGMWYLTKLRVKREMVMY